MLKDINRANLTIHDLSGKEIPVNASYYSENELQIDLSFAPAGLYFLQVTTLSGQTEVVKVVKKH